MKSRTKSSHEIDPLNEYKASFKRWDRKVEIGSALVSAAIATGTLVGAYEAHEHGHDMTAVVLEGTGIGFGINGVRQSINATRSHKHLSELQRPVEVTPSSTGLPHYQ
jgi:hypothetical protein